MPQILHEVQARYPGLVIHQVEASVPEQYQQLTEGHLDIGIGRPALAPPRIASLLFRQDPARTTLPACNRARGHEHDAERGGRGPQAIRHGSRG
jgi:DNA-binding transcriptional LysR family regulator